MPGVIEYRGIRVIIDDPEAEWVFSYIDGHHERRPEGMTPRNVAEFLRKEADLCDWQLGTGEEAEFAPVSLREIFEGGDDDLLETPAFFKKTRPIGYSIVLHPSVAELDIPKFLLIASFLAVSESRFQKYPTIAHVEVARAYCAAVLGEKPFVRLGFVGGEIDHRVSLETDYPVTMRTIAHQNAQNGLKWLALESGRIVESSPDLEGMEAAALAAVQACDLTPGQFCRGCLYVGPSRVLYVAYRSAAEKLFAVYMDE